MNTLIVLLALMQNPPDVHQLRYEEAYQRRIARQARLANRRNPYYPSSPLSMGIPQPFIIYFPQQQRYIPYPYYSQPYYGGY